MDSLLRWIYCDELVFEEGKLAAFLRLADKYMVNNLIRFVSRSCHKDRKAFVWSFLSMAMEFGDKYKQDIDSCTAVLMSRTRMQLEDPDSIFASPAVVKMFISSFENVDEDNLFKWAVKWAEKECERKRLTSQDKRQVMDPFIHQFAFPGMKQDIFAGIPCESGILSDKELVQIFRIMSGKDVESPFRKIARKAFPCISYKAGNQVPFMQCSGCHRMICCECYCQTDDDEFECCNNSDYHFVAGYKESDLCTGPE